MTLYSILTEVGILQLRSFLMMLLLFYGILESDNMIGAPDEKDPLVFSGCLLRLVGAGNLLADSQPFLAHAFSLTGLVLLVFLCRLSAIRWKKPK